MLTWGSAVRASLIPAVGLAVAILGALFALRHADASAIADWQQDLEVALEDQRDGIEAWLDTRRGTARLVASYPSAGEVLALSDTRGASAHLGPLLDAVARETRLEAVLLLRADGTTAARSGSSDPDDDDRALAREATTPGRVATSFSTAAGRGVVRFAAPVLPPGASRPTGAVVLREAADRLLYPALRKGLQPSQSAEVLLFEPTGSELRFLSPSRDSGPGGMLGARVSASVLGSGPGDVDGDRLLVGPNERQIEHVVVTGPLRTVPWRLACRVDRAEAVAGSRRETLSIVLGAMAAVAGLGLAWVGLREHRRAQREAQALSSTARLAAALDDGDDVALFLRDDGTITEARGPVRRLYGVEPSDLVGRSIDTLGPDAAKSGGPKAASCGGAAHRVETVHRRPDGREIPVELTVQRLSTASGPPLRMVRVQDVTERRAAADRLRASEEAHRILFDTNPWPTWVYDPTTLRTFAVNDRALEVYGYTREEFLAMSIYDLVPAQDRPRLERLAEERPATARVVREWRHVRRDGTVLPVRIVSGPTQYLGRPARIAVAEDLTEQRQAEETTRTLVRAVVQSPVSIVVTDREGLIEYVNPHFCRVTGYTMAEVLGQNPRILKSQDTPTSVHTELWGEITAGRTWQGELVNRRKDGTTFSERAAIGPVLDADGTITHFVAVKEDLTERRTIERRAQSAEEKFLQAQKLEAVGRLAGGIAHDFNNLLCVILGYGEMVAVSLGREHQASSQVEQIVAAARRAEGLTRQLLAFSRRQVLQPRVVDLHEIVGGIEKMIRRLIGEDVDLVTSFATTPAVVRVDPGQIEQVLLNLSVNARDAMPRGGRLSLRTRLLEVDATEDGGKGALHRGAWVILEVQDTGVGMDEATQARVFEPFFTTKPSGQGTGLGLATVHGIVSQSDGHVRFHSVPGEGTTFRVYLPCVEPLLAPEVAQPTDLTKHRGSERVLVVEDQEAVRGLVRTWLESLGYAVLDAQDGVQALEIAERAGGSLDLLLTDVVMPKMSGRELADRLTARDPRLRVLYMSGYTNEVVAAHGILDEGIRLLDKPLSPDVLARAVREVLDAAS